MKVCEIYYNDLKTGNRFICELYEERKSDCSKHSQVWFNDPGDGVFLECKAPTLFMENTLVSIKQCFGG